MLVARSLDFGSNTRLWTLEETPFQEVTSIPERPFPALKEKSFTWGGSRHWVPMASHSPSGLNARLRIPSGSPSRRPVRLRRPVVSCQRTGSSPPRISFPVQKKLFFSDQAAVARNLALGSRAKLAT